MSHCQARTARVQASLMFHVPCSGWERGGCGGGGLWVWTPVNFQNCKWPPSNIFNNKNFLKNKKSPPGNQEGTGFCFWLESFYFCEWGAHAKFCKPTTIPSGILVTAVRRRRAWLYCQKSVVIFPEERSYIDRRAQLYWRKSAVIFCNEKSALSKYALCSDFTVEISANDGGPRS